MRYRSVLLKRRFDVRLMLLCVLSILLSALICVPPQIQAASANDVVPFLEAYFEARYEALQNLQLPESFSSFFDPTVLSQSNLLNELERFQAYIFYRRAHEIDMHLTDGWQVRLSYPGVRFFPDRAEIIVNEQYEYAFVAAPDEIHRGTVSHVITLSTNAEGSWQIIRDEYQDPEGVLRQLSEAWHGTPGGNARLSLIASLLPRVEALEAERTHEDLDVMRDFPTQVVLFQEQSVLWANGRSLPLDPATRLTPMIWNGELYLPVRVLVESLGGSIEWTPIGRRSVASINGHTLSFSTFDYEVQLDDETIPMRQANTLVGNRSYLPATLLARLLERELYQSGNGGILLSPHALREDQRNALLNRLDELNQTRFSLNDFPMLAAFPQARELAMRSMQELLGLYETQYMYYMPHLNTDDPYARLIAGDVALVLGSAPNETEKAALRRANLDLDLLPLGDGLVMALRHDESLRSPARRLATWLSDAASALLEAPVSSEGR